MSDEQGAFVEPAAVGYHAARRGVKRGDNVVVLGAGTIGILAMQGAIAFGAAKSVICDFDAGRLKLAQNYGATDVIDFNKESLEEGLTRIFGATASVDCYRDCVGFDGTAMKDIISVARRGATIISVGIISPDFAIPNIPDITEHELNVFGSSMFWPEDFAEVIDHMKNGVIKVDGLISHTFKISDIKQMYEMVDKGAESYMKIMLDIDFEG